MMWFTSERNYKTHLLCKRSEDMDKFVFRGTFFCITSLPIFQTRLKDVSI